MEKSSILDFPLEVTSSGEILFIRSDKEEVNKYIYEILSNCSGRDIEDVRKFLEQGKDITLLFGDRIFCG